MIQQKRRARQSRLNFSNVVGPPTRAAEKMKDAMARDVWFAGIVTALARRQGGEQPMMTFVHIYGAKGSVFSKAK